MLETFVCASHVFSSQSPTDIGMVMMFHPPPTKVGVKVARNISCLLRCGEGEKEERKERRNDKKRREEEEGERRKKGEKRRREEERRKEEGRSREVERCKKGERRRGRAEIGRRKRGEKERVHRQILSTHCPDVSTGL